MLRSVKVISIWRMTKFVIIGFMCNNILPARLGEFARALVIANKEEISARSSFASVVLERVFDGVTIVLLLFGMIVFHGSLSLKENDLVRPREIIKQLKNSEEPYIIKIRAEFADETIALMCEYCDSSKQSEKLKEALLNDLNGIIYGDCIYDSSAFKGFKLSDKAAKLIKSNPTERELVYLNRLILEEVFRGSIAKCFPPWVKRMAMYAGILFLGCFIFLLLLGIKGKKWIKVIQDRFPKGIIGKAAGFMLKFVHGLDILKKRSLILFLFLLSFIIWGIEAGNYLIIMRSLDIWLPWEAAVFTLIVANLGIMIPSSPGNVGTMQYFIITGLALYEVLKDQALAFSLVLHAEIYFPITILGLIFLTQMGISLKSIRLSRRRVEELTEENNEY